MSDFITRLIARNTGQAESIRPHTPSMFEPRSDIAVRTVGTESTDASRPSVAVESDVHETDARSGRETINGEPLRSALETSHPTTRAMHADVQDDAPMRATRRDAPRPAISADSVAQAPEPRAPQRREKMHSNKGETSDARETFPSLRAGEAASRPIEAVRPDVLPDSQPPSLDVAPLSRRATAVSVKAVPPELPVSSADAESFRADRQKESASLQPSVTPISATMPTTAHTLVQYIAAHDAPRRKIRDAQDAARPGDHEPTVHVTIGRIEIRAEQAPVRNAAKPREGPQADSLADYLRTKRAARGRA